jgi:hypothetical protein
MSLDVGLYPLRRVIDVSPGHLRCATARPRFLAWHRQLAGRDVGLAKSVFQPWVSNAENAPCLSAVV